MIPIAHQGGHRMLQLSIFRIARVHQGCLENNIAQRCQSLNRDQMIPQLKDSLNIDVKIIRVKY